MSLLNELSRVLYKTKLSSFFLIRKHGFKMRFFPTKISKRLWVDSFRKKGVYNNVDKFFLRCLGPGDIVIDVGANVGYYTLLSAVSVGTHGHVYAVEAHPRTYKFLESNVTLNQFSQVSTYCTALGDVNGELKFSDQESDDLNQVSDTGAITVPVGLLDDLNINAEKIKLLKIDVEGYEKFVLAGGLKILEITETVFFESWDSHFTKYGYSLADIFELLEPFGFVYLLNLENGYKKITSDYESKSCVDIIATKQPGLFGNFD